MKNLVPHGANHRTTRRRPAAPHAHRCQPSHAGQCARCLSPVGRSHRYCAGCGLRLESPAGTGSEVQRRTVSVLFVDVVGYTDIAARLDPEALRALQAEYFRAVAEVIRCWGGIVEKYIGDAVMAVFGATGSDRRHAFRAVRAGVQIVAALRRLHVPPDQPLRVRVGVATGEAVVALGASDGGQGFVTGNVVNIAFRVQSHAAVGTVAVTDVTRAVTGSLLRYRRQGPLRVAGQAEPLEIWCPDPTAAPGGAAAAAPVGGSAVRAGEPVVAGDRSAVPTGRCVVARGGARADRANPAGKPRHRTWHAGLWRLGRCPPRAARGWSPHRRYGGSPRQFGSSADGDPSGPPPRRDAGALPMAAHRVPVTTHG